MKVDQGIKAVTQQYLDAPKPFRIEGDSYFADTNERCIEVPYVASQVRGERAILDIGTSLSDLSYFWLLTELARRNATRITTLDIIPFERVKNRVRDSFTAEQLALFDFKVGDVRDASFDDETFDLALCISVMEHVGFDQRLDDPSKDTVFDRPLDKPTVRDDEDAYYAHSADSAVLSELERGLKPGGRLILTVPYGQGQFLVIRDSKDRYSTEIQFNQRKWRELLSGSGMVVEDERKFSRYNAGWFEYTSDDEVDFSRQTGGVLCSTLRKPA